jgi:hypothetical protein
VILGTSRFHFTKAWKPECKPAPLFRIYVFKKASRSAFTSSFWVRQATLYTESSDSSVASAAASIATGWSEPVPGRELHPLESSAFHGALFRQQFL